MKERLPYIVIGVLAVLILVVSLMLVDISNSLSDQVARDEEELKWYKAQYPEKVTTTDDGGSYHILSTDKGKTWWRIDGNRAIVEPADPDLLKEIAGLEKLHSLRKKSGKSLDRRDLDVQKALIDAGFGVKVNPN